MNDTDNNKVSIKFWIISLAFATLLLATSLMMLATYLSEIKNNTAEAAARYEGLSQRLATMEMELAAIHHHIVSNEGKPAVTSAAASAPEAIAPATSGIQALPTIQAPTLAAPAGTEAPTAPAPAK